MSGLLASSLVGAAAIDNDLDALFGSSFSAPSSSTTTPEKSSKKRKQQESAQSESAKKKKSKKNEEAKLEVKPEPTRETNVKSETKKDKKKKSTKAHEEVAVEAPKKSVAESAESSKGIKVKKEKAKKQKESVTEKEEVAAVKPAAESKAAKMKKEVPEKVHVEEEEDNDEEDISEGDSGKLPQADSDADSDAGSGEDEEKIEEGSGSEAVEAGDDKEKSPEKKSRREVKKEIKEQNARTIFVGNLSIKATEKAGTKELKALFSKHGALDSIRFRSIARSDKMPRKVAFITKNFHPGRDTVNCYIVYKDLESVAKALAENGTMFMGTHIRVDRAERPEDNKHDHKRSVFVGALPFDIKEETVWNYFSQCGDVEGVRIVRDKGTNVGKGIGYVLFKDRASVGLAHKLHGSELAGRKIRVNRCKDVSPEAQKKRLSMTEGQRATRSDSTDKTKNGGVSKLRTRSRPSSNGKPFGRPSTAGGPKRGGGGGGRGGRGGFAKRGGRGGAASPGGKRTAKSD
ncbi:uncharacterized protein EV422DRAFT_305693 [Fimicolochytrium jonesii]|uniref:uncharacterized protein n=1 Tax=Fimicolochytrium jonesii TaxID=1396493 RepID=UPI0022FDBE60|nr:uncharacterized protein EV422DRAFT_305693 [Fimicolochytrium jonesii]KAI8824073.1 hypothetical protein EV422DRAFT_305693 [Fimicolochytrium jonesii]